MRTNLVIVIWIVLTLHAIYQHTRIHFSDSLYITVETGLEKHRVTFRGARTIQFSIGQKDQPSPDSP